MGHYLDYAASAPLRPEAAAAWAEAGAPGNPSSLHGPGRAARATLEAARETVARAFGADPAELIWTSGGSEADNLALAGLYRARQSGARRPHIIVSAVEHHAVLESARRLARWEGAKVTELPVGRDGIVRLDSCAQALERLGDGVALVSVMGANNETGALQPIRRIAEAAAGPGVPVHSDLVQWAGRLDLDFRASGLAAASLSAHKLGGPAGIGALLARRDAPLAPVGGGGGQERGVRSGTLDARGAAAFAAAVTAGLPARPGQADDAGTRLGAEGARLERLLAPLDALVERSGGLMRSRTPLDPGARIPGLRSITVPGCAAEVLLYLLDREGIAVSAGAACTAGVVRASHVLEAMGLDPAEAGSGLRVSLGWASAPADVAALTEALPRAVATALDVPAGASDRRSEGLGL